jgi:cell division ATPase FtsA
MSDAERLKEQFASLEENLPFGEELIPLVERTERENHQIKRSEFHRAFLGFGDEFLSVIEKAVRDLLKGDKIACPAYVLTGEGAKLEGFLESLGKRFSSPIRLGTPREVDAPPELLMDPGWGAVAGLLRWQEKAKIKGYRSLSREGLLEKTLFQAKEWLAAYF